MPPRSLLIALCPVAAFLASPIAAQEPGADWRDLYRALPGVRRDALRQVHPRSPSPPREGKTRAEFIAEAGGVALGMAVGCRLSAARILRLEGVVLNAILNLAEDTRDHEIAFGLYGNFRRISEGAARGPDCVTVDELMAVVERQMGMRW